ncbi:MAG: hypothetical protein KAT43_01435 [Nanoarchaeota archaeon]|nr:hypothetical protein [Nanoarchaeota archaeon]
MYNPYRITNRATKGEFLRRSFVWPGYAIVYVCKAPNFPEDSDFIPQQLSKKDISALVALEGFKLLTEAALVLTTCEALCSIVQKLS